MDEHRLVTRQPWNEVHVHDLSATMPHLLGLDHERLTDDASGRHFQLTDVYGNVVHDALG